MTEQDYQKLRRMMYKYVGTMTNIRTTKDKERNGLNTDSKEDKYYFQPMSLDRDEEYSAARSLQRANRSYNTFKHGMDQMDIKNSIIKMLIFHEMSLKKEWDDAFKFKLPNPGDLRRISEKLHNKEDLILWKAGAQYMINLNKTP